GLAAHLAGELFKAEAKIDIVHVPYKGAAPALQDVIAGDVQRRRGAPSLRRFWRDTLAGGNCGGTDYEGAWAAWARGPLGWGAAGAIQPLAPHVRGGVGPPGGKSNPPAAICDAPGALGGLPAAPPEWADTCRLSSAPWPPAVVANRTPAGGPALANQARGPAVVFSRGHFPRCPPSPPTHPHEDPP